MKHFPGARKGQRGGSKEDVSGGATAIATMEKGDCVRVIVRKEVRGDDLIEYFFPTGSEVPLEGVTAVEVPQNEKISGGGKNGGRKGVSSVIRPRRENRGAYTLRNESEEELFGEMLTPT